MKSRVKIIKDSRIAYNEAMLIRAAGSYWEQYRVARNMFPDEPMWSLRNIVRNARSAELPRWECGAFIAYGHHIGNYVAFGREQVTQ